MSIEVVKPGVLSTFQDLGRQGYQHLGVPCNGVMDERAHRVANWLVGNAPTQATLEITLMGPALKFQVPAVIAVSGADLSPVVNGEPMAQNAPVLLKAGDVLAFGARKSGLLAYLAVQGGYALSPVMGSTSTYLRGKYGGLDGAPLKKNMVIPLNRAAPVSEELPQRTLPFFGYGVEQGPDSPIRVVPGREYASFSPESVQAFASQPWRISPQSDRMGYRLSGPQLVRVQNKDILSEAVSAGTVQVPPDGQPIVLMADAQTTGGYPRIAHLAWVDLPRLAQRVPGETLHFEWITLEKAQRLAVAQGVIFRNMETTCTHWI